VPSLALPVFMILVLFVNIQSGSLIGATLFLICRSSLLTSMAVSFHQFSYHDMPPITRYFSCFLMNTCLKLLHMDCGIVDLSVQRVDLSTIIIQGFVNVESTGNFFPSRSF